MTTKKITCKKPCNIGGVSFVIGDDVPEELIAPGREATLAKFGLISVATIYTPDTPIITDTHDGGSDDTQQSDGEDQKPEDDRQNEQPEQSTTETPDDGEKKTGKRGKK